MSRKPGHCLPLVFNETPMSLSDVLRQGQLTLPRVIKCCKQSLPHTQRIRINLDICQPLLAFMKRSVVKVSAHSLQYDPRLGDFVTVGNGVLVPQDYPGWFAVLGAPAEVTHHYQTIPHYRTISNLATSGCSKFLIGGKHSVLGILKDKSKTIAEQHKMYPGTVLHQIGLFQQAPLEKSTNSTSKKKNKTPDVPPCKYLKCRDELGREIFIDVRQQGIFYVITKYDRPAVPAVLQMVEILKRFHLPLIVQLLYGRVPTSPCAFTQVLLLTDSGINHTLVASTMLSSHNINMEIPIGTRQQYFLAENTEALLNSATYIKVLKECEDKVASYIKDIKVVFGVPQTMTDGKLNKETPHETASEKSASGLNETSSQISKEKSDSNNSLAHTFQSPYESIAEFSLNKPFNGLVPRRPVSTMSTVSHLTSMTEQVTINEDSFIYTEQPDSKCQEQPDSKCKVPSTSPHKNTNTEVECQLSVNKSCMPPNPDSQNSILATGQASKPHNIQAQKSHKLHIQLPVSFYDNAPSLSPNTSSTELTKCFAGSLSTISERDSLSSQSMPNIYDSSWVKKKKPTAMMIPSKPGQPVSPSIKKRSSDCLPMHQLTSPAPSPMHQLTPPAQPPIHQLTPPAQPPIHQLTPPGPPPKHHKTSPPPQQKHQQNSPTPPQKHQQNSQIPPQKHLQNSPTSLPIHHHKIPPAPPFKSINQAKTLKPIPAKLHSINEGEASNLKLEPPNIPGPYQQHSLLFTSAECQLTNSSSSQCQASTNSINSHITPTLTVNKQNSNYIDPIHKEYSLNSQRARNEYDEPGTWSLHPIYSESRTYSQLMNTTDNTVCEDENGYTKYNDKKCIAQNKSSDEEMISTNSAPRLPPRHNSPKPVSLRHVVAKTVPEVNSLQLGQINKHILLTELRKAGIKKTAEMAFAGLESADIAILLSRNNDFDETLYKLLPNIGQFDLSILAMCLRGIKQKHFQL